MPGKKRKSAKKPPASKKKPRATDTATESRPKKYKKWGEESMKSVTEGTAINRAEAFYDRVSPSDDLFEQKNMHGV